MAVDVDYKGYLKINDLLQLQQPLAQPPSHDETLFIVVHQVFELWFRLLLHEIDKVFELLDQDEKGTGGDRLRMWMESGVGTADQFLASG